ncbi:MAG: 50S ribosomal protein L9, partial [Nocardioidaceae bacterium]|nr:50S ribosomal protein L9 [Nocardioidaceae bacterium]
KDGYGRNYLVPRGLATRWTRGGQKTIDSIKQARSARAVRGLDHAEEIKAKLEQGAVNVKVRAGQGGRLFGAVTVGEIADALSAASGESVDKRTIAVANPIKTLGAHEVSVKLHDEVSAKVALNVVPS